MHVTLGTCVTASFIRIKIAVLYGAYLIKYVFELALNDEFIIVYLFATQKSLLMRTCSDIEINVQMICPDDLSGFFIR